MSPVELRSKFAISTCLFITAMAPQVAAQMARPQPPPVQFRLNEAAPALQTIEPSVGATPPPVINFELRADGVQPVPADQAPPPCMGFVNANPQVTFATTTPLLFGRFFTHMSGDPTVIVRDPRGQWHCNDDTIGLNASVDLRNVPAGIFRVWVGRTDASQRSEGRLYFTRDEHVSLATMRGQTGQLLVAGRVCVASDAPATQVRVDQRPEPLGVGCIDQLSVGWHQFAMSAPGFAPRGYLVQVGPQLSTMLFAASLRHSGRSATTALYTQSIDALQASCTAGNADGCLTLGLRLSDAFPTAMDLPRAHQAFVRACAANNAEGCAHAGAPLIDLEPTSGGPSTDAERSTHFSFLSRGCELHNQTACRLKAQAIGLGRGTPQNRSECLQLLTQTCAAGELYACGLQGNVLLDSQYGPPNPRLAVTTLQTACTGGEAVACAVLGSVLEHGEPGVAPDLARAYDAYVVALAAGNADAQRALGMLRVPGQAPVEDARMFRMFSAACDSGRVEACRRVATLTSIQSFERESVLTSGCGRRDAESCHELAWVNLRTQPGSPAPVLALQRACRLGHRLSCEQLEWARALAQATATTPVEQRLAQTLALFEAGEPVVASARVPATRLPRARGATAAPTSPDVTVVITQPPVVFANEQPLHIQPELRGLEGEFPVVRFRRLGAVPPLLLNARRPEPLQQFLQWWLSNSGLNESARLLNARHGGPAATWLRAPPSEHRTVSVFAGQRWIGGLVFATEIPADAAQTLRRLIVAALIVARGPVPQSTQAP